MPTFSSALNVSDFLREHIRTVPDWPSAGVQFRDITPLLQNPQVFRVLIDAFVHRYMDPDLRPDVVAGLDARGFIIGAVVAYELNVGFVPIRKKGKLPFTTVEETYELESDQVWVYAYGRTQNIWWKAVESKVAKARNLHVLSVDVQESQDLAKLAQRSMELNFNVQDGTVYINSAQGDVAVTLSALRAQD